MSQATSSDTQNADAIITRLGGCGRFQLTVAVTALWVRVVTAMSMVMMMFGNYNPGWRCLDNSTDTDASGLNITTPVPLPSDNAEDIMCQVHDLCTDVQFTPGISTVVSEWRLICDRSWALSFIISFQMVGVFVGAHLAGYLGDKFGRKRVTVWATICHVVVNVIILFSSSWQIFAVLRFLIGLAIPSMAIPSTVLVLEFVPPKWRNAVNCCPVWPISCILFTLLAMATESWQYLHVINAVTSFIILFPLYWVPESLRWLLVKERMKQASAIIRNIAYMNGKKIQRAEITEWISNYCKRHSNAQVYSCFHYHLLKRGFRYPTFAFGFICLSVNLVYYAITFGMKALPGNLYVNLIISFSCDLSMTSISLTIPNYLGRKVSIIIFLTLSTCSLFTIVGLDVRATDQVKGLGVLVAAVVAMASMGAVWDVSCTFVGEIYPTRIRSTSISYMLWISRAGAILAPYLIPNNEDAYIINYCIMAACALLCCVLAIFLPETKGRPLQDQLESHDANL